MNHTKASFLKKQSISLVFLVILSVLIWHYGPLISIGNTVPLQLPEKRLYLISICFLLWLLKIIAFDIQSHPAPSQSETTTDAGLQKTQLKGRFEGAVAFLKKTFIDKQGKKTHLAKLPWYLMMGPTGAGKTTLLTHSGIHFILAKQSKTPGKILPSTLCDWWATRDLVLVDVPGDYLNTSTVPTEKTAGTALWQYFLELIKTSRFNTSMQGVIIALNLPELMKGPRSSKKPIALNIKKPLLEMAALMQRQVPVHLVITKCDLLPGFNEFFSELSHEELAQAWGITLPALDKNENLTDVFTTRFNALIKRINTQLISRLHQERNPLARPYIKDFPLHLERLKDTIAQFIKLHLSADLHLHSVYLTSSSQNTLDEPPSYLANASVGQSLQLMAAPPPPQRAYFVKQFLLHQLPQATSAVVPLKPVAAWQRHLAYATAISVVAGGALFLGRDFQLGVQQTRTIQTNLAHYQNRVLPNHPSNDYLLNSLPLLNALREAAHQSSHPLLFKFYSKKSQETAETIYQQALQTIVLPTIKNYFAGYLQTANMRSPEQIYAVLAAYLMLADKTHFQVEYIATILKPFLPANANKNDLLQLANYIYDALNTNHLSVKLNAELIDQSRRQLAHLSNVNLGFVLLKNNGHNNIDSLVSLGTNLGNPPVFNSKVVAMQIPSMFTAKEFNKIVTEESNAAANEALNGNWVLGAHEIIASPLAVESLATQIRTQYIANYVDIWESLLANLELTPPANLAQVAEMVAIITGDHSPLLQVLDTLKQNTAFAPITTASPKLQNLSVVLLDAGRSQTSLLYQIFISLKQLDVYLKTIMQSTDRSTAILSATAKRMQNSADGPLSQLHMIAEQSPEPMKTWLNTLATQTWKHLLFASGTEIEKIWENSILLTYKTQMEDRYPFNPTATREVGLQQFTQFFGQQGLFANFYQGYVKPFVVEEQNHLTWRVVDNAKLPFSEATLQRLEHANRLQKAFFPNGDNKLYVPFTLQPLAIDKTVKEIMLNINGQEAQYLKNTPTNERLLVWPGTNLQHGASVNFIAADGSTFTKTMQGEWGWFKLVNKATQAVRSRKELVLNFNVDGHSAKYLLLTQGQFNPFLPVNLERFALPESLG